MPQLFATLHQEFPYWICRSALKAKLGEELHLLQHRFYVEIGERGISDCSFIKSKRFLCIFAGSERNFAEGRIRPHHFAGVLKLARCGEAHDDRQIAQIADGRCNAPTLRGIGKVVEEREKRDDVHSIVKTGEVLPQSEIIAFDCQHCGCGIADTLELAFGFAFFRGPGTPPNVLIDTPEDTLRLRVARTLFGEPDKRFLRLRSLTKSIDDQSELATGVKVLWLE